MTGPARGARPHVTHIASAPDAAGMGMEAGTIAEPAAVGTGSESSRRRFCEGDAALSARVYMR
jgi:hypothetical protein